MRFKLFSYERDAKIYIKAVARRRDHDGARIQRVRCKHQLAQEEKAKLGYSFWNDFTENLDNFDEITWQWSVWKLHTPSISQKHPLVTDYLGKIFLNPSND